ncbi:hypothetical protein EDC04DRAFT_3126570 [Pisolithus marmoratus]|nr:hypothetical protein EDC04DRAFT_3126570 [Pisolithus marmoratus]
MTYVRTQRILRFAFGLLLKTAGIKVTCMHKANIMKLGGSLFLHTFCKVAEDYKSLGCGRHFDELYSSMQLIVKPAQFEMMVMPNLYSPIIFNIGRALVSGTRCSLEYNIGIDYAPFRPGCRCVASDFTGANHAPTAMILSATMMLRHLW